MPEARPRKLLVFTRFNPLSGVSGTGTYLFSMLEYLRRNGLEITLAWSERPEPAARRGWWIVPREIAQTATLIMPGALCLGRLRVFPGVWTGPVRAALRRWAKRVLIALRLWKPAPAAPTPPVTAEPAAPVNPYQWDRPPDPYEHEFFAKIVTRLRPDAVAFNYCWMTPLAESLPASVRTLTFTHDLQHLYSTLVDGAIRHTEGEYMSKALERDYLRRSKVIVAIREDDAELFRQMLPDHKVIVATPSLVPHPPAATPVPGRCLFVAAENVANREGLLWFLDEVWPEIRAAQPSAEFHVCGNICKSLPPGELPGVVRRGFVDDLAAAYGEASVVVVTLLRGSGVKIKLMEALAHGKACVSTPIGTEGVPVLDGCVRVAATPGGFAREVIELLATPASRETLEQRAVAAVREHFTPETCYRPLLDALRS